MKTETVPGMVCVCKHSQQSRWNRQSNFARIWRVAQEAKKDWAISGSMIGSGNAIAVRSANRPSALVAAPCLRDYAPQQSWWSLLSPCWRLDVQCKRLCRRMDWMSARWLRGRPRRFAVPTGASGHHRARAARFSPRASRRDPSESAQYGGVDGTRNDGLNPPVAGWGGESHAR